MDPTDQLVAEKFALFEQERDPARIYEALERVETLTRTVSPDDLAAIGGAFSNWLNFFAELDRELDPGWDPDDLPVAGVVPPVDDCVVFSSGEVDPAAIPDPAARAAYQQALESGKEAERRFSIQFQLRRIEERALRHAAILLAGRRDRPEIDGLLAASRASESRKQQLRAMIQQP